MSNIVKINRKKPIENHIRHIEAFLELTPNLVSFPLKLTPVPPSAGCVETYTLESLLEAIDEIECQLMRGEK